MPHALDRDRDDVDLALLNVELSERLGRPVVLAVRWPGQQDDDGEALPGVLVIRDPDTGEEIDADGRTVRAAIDTHEPPERPADEVAMLRAELDEVRAEVVRMKSAAAQANVAGDAAKVRDAITGPR
jgi:hypothetical protein